MPRFEPGISITTREPTIVVDPGLPAGSHTFRLVVVDSSGNTSVPVEMTITVQRPVVVGPVRPSVEVIRPGLPPIETIQPVRPTQPTPAGPTTVVRPRGRGGIR